MQQALRVLALVSSTPALESHSGDVWEELERGSQRKLELAKLLCDAATIIGRRRLLVELDVLASMGILFTLDHLCLLWRVHFPVLQEYERSNRDDQHGRLVPTSATVNGRDAASLGKLAALLVTEVGFDSQCPYEPGTPESGELLAQIVKLSTKDATVIGVPERCRLDELFAETEVTYYPPDGTTPSKKTLFGIRHTDPGLHPEQSRTNPIPWTAPNRGTDYRTVWQALERLEASA